MELNRLSKLLRGQVTGSGRQANFKAALPELNGLQHTERLMLLLLTALCNPFSQWRHFVRVLPDSQAFQVPWYHWSAELVVQLEGSPAFHYVKHLRKWFHGASKNVCRFAEGLGLNPLVVLACDQTVVSWLFMIVRTRSFDCPDEKGALLLPLADMINHSPWGPSFFLPFSSGSGWAGLVAPREMAIGEEIVASYEDSSNANLLTNYGFLVPGNRHNSVPVPRVACPIDFEALGSMNQVDGESNATYSGAFLIYADGRPSDELLSALSDCCRSIVNTKAGFASSNECTPKLLLRHIDELLQRYSADTLSMELARRWPGELDQVNTIVEEEKTILLAARRAANQGW